MDISVAHIGKKDYKLESLYFYSLFFIHLLTYRYSFLAASYVGISVLFLLSQYRTKYKLVNLIWILLAFIFTAMSLSMGIHFREMAFFLWFILLYLSFLRLNFPLQKMLTFLNSTYLVYLFFSLLVTFHFINGGLRSEQVHLNQFDANFFNFSWITLTGFSGTTAGIDSYAMLIFIINALFKSKYRWPMIIIAFTSVLFTTRMTPWAMILLTIVYIPLGKNRFLIYLLITAILSSFLIPIIFRGNNSIELFFFAVTHGRSFVWSLYYDLLVESPLSEILLGIRTSEIPYVFLSNNTGSINAPHSSYFRLLIANGLILYIFFYFVLVKILISSWKKGKKAVFVVVAILVAGITNENIFHNHNPIYLLVLLYFSISKSKIENTIKL